MPRIGPPHILLHEHLTLGDRRVRRLEPQLPTRPHECVLVRAGGHELWARKVEVDAGLQFLPARKKDLNLGVAQRRANLLLPRSRNLWKDATWSSPSQRRGIRRSSSVGSPERPGASWRDFSTFQRCRTLLQTAASFRPFLSAPRRRSNIPVLPFRLSLQEEFGEVDDRCLPPDLMSCQCQRNRRPVNTMAIPCSSAASITEARRRSIFAPARP